LLKDFSKFLNHCEGGLNLPYNTSDITGNELQL